MGSTLLAFSITPPQFDLKCYAAKIDTTFAVYRKSNFRYDFYDGVRVAGAFSAIHLPWFPELDIMTAEEKASYLDKNNISATWGAGK